MDKNNSRGFFFLLFFCVFFLIHCSFPRIIVLKDPLTPEEHVNLGVTYEKNSELDAAIKEYKEAAKKLPVANLYLGNVYFLKNDLKSAEAYYRQTIEKAPETADAYNNLAWLYYTEKKNLDEAESLVIRALDLRPSKADIYRDTLNKIRELRKNTPE
jgi:tetratricopeptide (TPR) repeat protein